MPSPLVDDTVRRSRDPLLDIALGPALLQQVAEGGGPELLRVYRPRPTLAFSGRDCASPGIAAAAAAARAAGFVPVRRGPGGRAAAYHRGALCLDHVGPDPDGIATIRLAGSPRFGELLAGALRELGVDAELGPVPGEYCPGEFSINDGHGHKLVGTAQRLVRGGWLFGTVILVADPEPVREVLTEVYDALTWTGTRRPSGAVQTTVPGVTVEDVRAAVLHGLRAVGQPVPAGWRRLDDRPRSGRAGTGPGERSGSATRVAVAGERRRIAERCRVTRRTGAGTYRYRDAMVNGTTSGIDPDDLRAVPAGDRRRPRACRRSTPTRSRSGGRRRRIFKSVKNARRAERRDAISAADKAVVAATATGSPDRIDDETEGIPLVSNAAGALAGIFVRPRPCYICKQDYVEVDAFYHQLCPSCAADQPGHRDARTDLTGRRALLTGGRAKIGMYIALRLLRDGAHTTITTRFPGDAVRRFTAMPDSADWLHRLRIVGIDLRDPAQVVALADSVAEAGPLDILINNAAQTVRRSPGAYAPLAAAESDPLPDGPLPELLTFDHISDAHPHALAGSLSEHPLPHLPDGLRRRGALPAGAAGRLGVGRAGARPAGPSTPAAWCPDLHRVNSWTQRVDEVDPLELLEVQLCNMTAPFILVSRLRAAMAASPARRKYIVNVSAMEGVFGRGYKGPGHPHTNMAKAALNMLTRTSAAEMLTDGILMTAVDTGWITDERPHFTKVRLAEEGFHAPLDLVDGAARVYDPIVQGEAGVDLYGCFLKDYRPAAVVSAGWCRAGVSHYRESIRVPPPVDSPRRLPDTPR